MKNGRRALADPAPWIQADSAVAALALPAVSFATLAFRGGAGILAPAFLAFSGRAGRTGFLAAALFAFAGGTGRTRPVCSLTAWPAVALTGAGALGARRSRGSGTGGRLGRARRTHIAGAAGRMFGADVVAMALGARGSLRTAVTLRAPLATGSFRGRRTFGSPVAAFALLVGTRRISGGPFVGSSAGAAFLVALRGRRTPLGFAILAPGRARRQHQGGRHVHRSHRPSSM